MNKDKLIKLISSIKGSNKSFEILAKNELDKKMKPIHSLGVLEDLDVQLSGIYGFPLKELKNKCHIVVVADNGVIEEGVSSCPIEYTSLVAEAMLNKIAAIGIFCEQLNINVDVVNVGMKNTISRKYPHFYEKPILKGTKNFYKEKAMSVEDVCRAINLGINLIEERKQFDIFSNGEMGIANTTTSSAILYSLTKDNLDNIVGRGGGLSDEALNKKKNVIKESCEKYNTFELDIVDMLSCVGGLDICTMVGMYIGCAKNNKAMLVDGFISSVAALVAFRLNPNIADYFIFTHKSEEPGMQVIYKELNKKYFLDMKMRLGEGTGAVLAYPIIDCAVKMMSTMKTPQEVYKIFGINK